MKKIIIGRWMGKTLHYKFCRLHDKIWYRIIELQDKLMQNHRNKKEPHCIKHCKIDYEGNTLKRPKHKKSVHKLKNWDDCWECYLEDK